MAEIKVEKADITKLEVDAVVNAANSKLKPGGGVDGAIHRAGGPSIDEELEEFRPVGCSTGEAVITGAGRMPARHVIHTVGPVWSGGGNNEESLLRNAYQNSLKLADKHGLKSIAFPNISTGVYGFPKEKAAGIAIDAVKGCIDNTGIERVIFVCFDHENQNIYNRILNDD